MKSFKLTAYQRATLITTPSMEIGVYITHHDGVNHLTLGTYAESKDGLQRTHIPGPLIHEEHVDAFLTWFRTPGNFVYFADAVQPRKGAQSLSHPFSSAGDCAMLSTQNSMPLSLGKFLDTYLLSPHGKRENLAIAPCIADLLQKVRAAVWGDPVAEDLILLPFGQNDKRLAWLNYDNTIDKLRLGFGFFGGAGEPILGDTSYVFDRNDYQQWAAMHFYYNAAPVHILAVPPGWHSFLSRDLAGFAKTAIAVEVLKLGDRAWIS